MSQALVRIAAGWLLGLMLAVAAAVVAVNVVNNTMASPHQPVREYLDALQRGEGGKALGLLRATVPSSDASMLDGTALQTAASRITNVKLGKPEPREGKRVAVPMEYTIDGSQLSTEFLLEKTGTEWLFFNTWAFVPAPLPKVDVSVVNAVEATMNGVPVNMPDGRNTFAVFYPGEYEASVNGAYFAAAPSRATVTGRDVPVAPLTLLTQATQKLKDDVGAKVREFLDSCAAEATEAQRLQPDCPFYHVSRNNITAGSIKWDITEYPEINIEPFDGRWVIAPLDGKAKVTGQQQDSFSGAYFPLNEEVAFSFTTRLDVTSDAVNLTPQLTY
ncbi:hypothetical protein V1639_14015 [Pseudarthrobacter sp. J75]|uniref:hypothetical protein n=1 Tax=unclassified Pseudarthrobacter TaxID=2647000 RepID=UPI002E80A0F8|nr:MULTISPECIES: hypothetical protein [unclassified Pseudarthrobacter]MEE2524268.1 hypothetical protein [Pseudarthrobacter sp. J47]MEE2530136.1 hypothetical protein [Pseudarthrobacter sp. J75]